MKVTEYINLYGHLMRCVDIIKSSGLYVRVEHIESIIDCLDRSNLIQTLKSIILYASRILIEKDFKSIINYIIDVMEDNEIKHPLQDYYIKDKFFYCNVFYMASNKILLSILVQIDAKIRDLLCKSDYYTKKDLNEYHNFAGRE